MSPRHVVLFLALLAAVAVRLFGPTDIPDVALVTAVPSKKLRVAATDVPVSATGAASQPIQVDEDIGMVRNAFVAKGLAAAVKPAVPTVTRAAAAVVVPQAARAVIIPDTPSPYQVIGTWQDAAGFAVFLAGPHGVRLARQGLVVDEAYKVVAANAQQLSMVQVGTNRQISLSVPRAPTAPPMTIPNR